MSIQAMQRRENIEGSIEEYLENTLVEVDGVKIHWPRVPFNPSGLASWVKLDYLPAHSGARHRRVDSSGTRGREVFLQMQLSIFARRHTAAGAEVNRFALKVVRDKILGRIQIGMEIDVADYANDSGTTVDTIAVEDMSEELIPTSTVATSGPNVATEGDCDQYVITVTLRYTEPHGAT